MAPFHSHCLIIPSLRKQCWRQQCLFIALNIVNCPSFEKVIAVIKDRQPVCPQLVSGREAECAQHAGCHNNRHMALTYMNGCQQGQMCWETPVNRRTFIKVMSDTADICWTVENNSWYGHLSVLTSQSSPFFIDAPHQPSKPLHACDD